MGVRTIRLQGLLKTRPKPVTPIMISLAPWLRAQTAGIPHGLPQNNYATYFVLNPAVSGPEFQEKLKGLVEARVYHEVAELFNAPLEDVLAGGTEFEYRVMPLTDIHLRSNLMGEHETNGNIVYIWLFSGNRTRHSDHCVHQLYQFIDCHFCSKSKRSRCTKGIGFKSLAIDFPVFNG